MKNIFASKRGVHPPEIGGGKRVTGAMPIENAVAPDTVAIALSQHIGAPCKPLVEPGDAVRLGQKIGEPTGFMGAPVHASVSGTVKEIQARTMPNGQMVDCIIIENDGLDTWDSSLLGVQNPDTATAEVLRATIRQAGVVGLGGATFPTHVKLCPPSDKPIEYLILNGAECEPYLTTDHRAMLEDTQAILDGMRLAARIVDAKKLFIGIEENKPDAIEAMQKAVAGTDASVFPLPVRYPQGGEKQLIETVTKRQVPSGKLPMDIGCVVINVSTAAAISRAVREGKPVIERVITVTGAVKNPKNLRVRIGTDVQSIISQCGGALDGVNKIVLGGPMMGTAIADTSAPVVKGTSGVLLMIDTEPSDRPVGNCIRCAACVRVCPVALLPLTMYALARKGLNERARDEVHLLDCIECGCCSYICPAKLPLVHTYRAAKRALPRK